MTNTRSGMKPAAIKEMINQRVAEALEAHEINRNLGLENLNGNDIDKNGNGNGNGNGQGGNKNGDGRGDRPVAHGVKRWKQCFTSATVRKDTNERAYEADDQSVLPRNEIQNMETELWNFLEKNNDMATYTQKFQEPTMMCTKMGLKEEDRVEKFVG
nr:reverse transcriptase domain-containing protein [Tanacetum cinerariifolium]